MRIAVRGLTLLEVLITLVLIGILVGIAVPSYQENVRRSRRSEAQSALLSVVQDMERFYTRNNTYTGYTIPGGRDPQFYTLTADLTGGGQGYTLTATRKTGTNQSSDKCGDYSITSEGLRTMANASLPQSQCWSN